MGQVPCVVLQSENLGCPWAAIQAACRVGTFIPVVGEAVAGALWLAGVLVCALWLGGTSSAYPLWGKDVVRTVVYVSCCAGRVVDSWGRYSVTMPVLSHAPTWAPCLLPALAVGNCLSTMQRPTITSSNRKTLSRFLTTYAKVAMEKRWPDGNRALIFASPTPSTSIFTIFAAHRSIED